MRKMIGFSAGVMLVTGIASTSQALPLSSTVKGVDSFSSAEDNGAGLAINNHYPNTFYINLIAPGSGHSLLPGPATLHLDNGQLEGTVISGFPMQDASLYLPSLAASLSPNALASWGSFNVPSEVFVNGTEIGGLLNINADHKSFSGTDTSLFDPTNPFRLTEVLPLDFGTTTGITSFDSSAKVTPTPEPGAMMLLGAGFLGLAIYGKRRKNT